MMQFERMSLLTPRWPPSWHSRRRGVCSLLAVMQGSLWRPPIFRWGNSHRRWWERRCTTTDGVSLVSVKGFVSNIQSLRFLPKFLDQWELINLQGLGLFSSSDTLHRFYYLGPHIHWPWTGRQKCQEHREVGKYIWGQQLRQQTSFKCRCQWLCMGPVSCLYMEENYTNSTFGPEVSVSVFWRNLAW